MVLIFLNFWSWLFFYFFGPSVFYLFGPLNLVNGLSSLKLNVSFQIGACGSAETAFAALSLKEGIIPATLVLESQNVGLRIFLFQRLKGKLVPERPRSK